MATQIQQILRNETVTLATPGFSKPGYAIAGWVTEDHVKSGTPDYQPNQVIAGGFEDDNTELYALWKKDFSQCTMTVSPTSYSYSGDDPTYPIASVDKPTVTVVDAEGKTLTKGVDYSLSFEPTTGSIAAGHSVTLSAFTVPLDPDTTGQLVKTYTAHYSQNVYYTLSVFITPDGGGTVAGTPFGSYPYGTFYSLSAVSNSGYWFYKWDDGSSTNFYPNIQGNLTSYYCPGLYFKPAVSSSANPVKSSSSSTPIYSPDAKSYKHIGAYVTNNNSADVTIYIRYGTRYNVEIVPAGQSKTFSTMNLETGATSVTCREAGSGEGTDTNVTVTIYWLSV